MTVYNRLTIGGTLYDEAERITVERSASTFNSSSEVRITFPNHNGRYSNDFVIGEEIKVWAQTGSFPDGTGTPIFVGIIEDINFSGRATNIEKIYLSGRDYSCRLMDATVAPVLYTSQEVSTIVTSIINANVSNITTTNVNVTGTTIPAMAFNHTPVFDALKQLAEIAGFYFYIDSNKDLNFKAKGVASSGYTFSSGVNVIEANVKTIRDKLYNKVWVYGDRVLTNAPRQSFTANGGSVYTLNYKPSNTAVYVAGSTASKIGGVFEMLAGTPGSPTQYLVDYDNKQIVFVSGTSAGMNVPASGSVTFVVDFQRQTPIVKYGQDDGSVLSYGPKTYVVVDKAIKDPQQAQTIMVNTLVQYSSPQSQVSIDVQGFFDLTPGTTAVVNDAYHGITAQNYTILSASYEFTQENNLHEEVLSVKLNQRVLDVSDTLKQMLLDIKKMQAGDADASDTIQRTQFSTGSTGPLVKSWRAYSRTLGSSFVLGHPTLGILGTTSPQPYLGDSRGPLVLLQSGNYWEPWDWSWNHTWLDT